MPPSLRSAKKGGGGGVHSPPSSDSPVTNDAGEGYSGQVFDKAPSNSPIPQSDNFKPEIVFLLFYAPAPFQQIFKEGSRMEHLLSSLMI